MKTSKRVTAAVLVAAVLSALLLTACSAGGTAMSCGSAAISERVYYYWLSQYKSYFLSSFEGAADTEEFWKSEAAHGATMEEYLREIADINIKKNVVCLMLFDEYGLKLSETAAAAVEADMADLLESYGSKAELNTELASLGINYDILRKIYLMQEKISAVYEYLYGENGVKLPTDEELDAYYREHFTRVKYIALNLFTSSVNSSGTTVNTDLTEAEANERVKLAESLAAQIRGGADIDKLIAERSDEDMTGYENGVYFSDSVTGYELINRARALGVNEVGVIRESRAVYVIKRLELEEKPYLDDTMNQFDTLLAEASDAVFQNMLLSHIDEVEVNGQIADEIKLSEVYY